MKRVAVVVIVGAMALGVGFTAASGTRGPSVTAASTTTVPGATTVPLASSPFTVPTTTVTTAATPATLPPAPPTIPLEDTPLVDAGCHPTWATGSTSVMASTTWRPRSSRCTTAGTASCSTAESAHSARSTVCGVSWILPEWPYELMKSTTSLFGLVTVTVADGYTVRWAYHPDSGALVVLNDDEAA